MSARRLLTCRELIDFLAAYVEGELAADVRAEFDRHLAVCPHCVDYLHGYRETLRLARAALASESELAEQAPEELVTAILAARRRV
jgi:anti-sigma factor RsiW